MKTHRINATTCCRPDCNKPIYKSGLCNYHLNEYQRAWRKRDRIDNPIKNRWRDHRRWAGRSKHVVFSLEKDWYINWIKNTKACEYCGVEGQYLQVDRKDPKEGYIMGNVALVCRKCNLVKSNVFTPGEWKDIVKKYNLRERFWGNSAKISAFDLGRSSSPRGQKNNVS